MGRSILLGAVRCLSPSAPQEERAPPLRACSGRSGGPGDARPLLRGSSRRIRRSSSTTVSSTKATMAESPSVLALPHRSTRRASRAPRSSRSSPSSTRARTPLPCSRRAPPRRHALDDALAEIEAGRERAVGRVAAQLLAHARPRAPARPGRAAPGRRHRAVRPPGRRALRHADRAAGRGPGRRRATAAATAAGTAATAEVEELPSGEVELEGDEEISDDDEPLDWDRRGRGGGRATPRPPPPRPPTTRNAARRFWFEHATGAGKTVAALGFVEGIAHRRRPDPHPPPQPRRPVPRRAEGPRLPQAHRAGAAEGRRRSRRPTAR